MQTMVRKRGTSPHVNAALGVGVGVAATVDVVLIGAAELRVRLAGEFVAAEVGPAARRLRHLGALGFELVEVDATGISAVDAVGRKVLDEFLRRIDAAGSRLEAFDPARRLAMPNAA
jgi:hypothetical protein